MIKVWLTITDNRLGLCLGFNLGVLLGLVYG